ncbi:hypothetical protein CKAN_00843700 [Cinnamomum micranthum f. kanehirae]|uniref:Uncharacterized protein n=1 Tax=Cinnamomum micranthum f. kanehirae TaxID=337451 RepID=A0A443NMW0_9MAGN|nr:hypothetical protein CKAN_00843700 [Cinnamomum micranthum f. kanehirae]
MIGVAVQLEQLSMTISLSAASLLRDYSSFGMSTNWVSASSYLGNSANEDSHSIEIILTSVKVPARYDLVPVILFQFGNSNSSA